jgi:hypothetical protein
LQGRNGIEKVEVLDSFRRMAKKLKMPDLEETAVEAVLENPEAGTVIPGAGGLRKVRIPLPNTGKRGGARVLYLLVWISKTAVLFGVLAKSNQEDFPHEFLMAAKQRALGIKKLVGE